LGVFAQKKFKNLFKYVLGFNFIGMFPLALNYFIKSDEGFYFTFMLLFTLNAVWVLHSVLFIIFPLLRSIRSGVREILFVYDYIVVNETFFMLEPNRGVKKATLNTDNSITISRGEESVDHVDLRVKDVFSFPLPDKEKENAEEIRSTV